MGLVRYTPRQPRATTPTPAPAAPASDRPTLKLKF